MSDRERARAASTIDGDAWRLGIVLLLAIGLRYWMVTHTTLVSRDCIRFVRFACIWKILRPAMTG